MANIKTVSLTMEEYSSFIRTIPQGFVYFDESGKQHKFRKNEQLAIVLQLQANVGLRIGDILKLRLADIVKDGNRYCFNDYVEQKTRKKRSFTIPNNIYSFICTYAMEKGISKEEPLFKVSERAIQKQLAIVCDYLGMERVSTHSFRKTFATTIYNESGYNLELVKELLQHSSSATTQRYIGVSSKQVETALQMVTDKLLIG